MGRLLAVAAIVTTMSCSQLFGLESPIHGDGGTNVVDAGPCTDTSSTCVADVLRECKTIGALPVDTGCEWGCLGDPTAHCGVFTPTGGGVEPTDLVDTPGLETKVFSDGLIFDTDTGAIGTTVNPTSVRGSGSTIISGIDFQSRGNVSVFRFRSVEFVGAVSARGTKALGVVGIQFVHVAGGVIDARGTCVNRSAGPGGLLGGAIAGGAAGPGGGDSGNNTGGGGGAFGGNGGVGGRSGGNGASGGSAFGDPMITVLTGGGGGGGGDGGGLAGEGGGGGGAVQLVSNTEVSILTGGINAGGCGGEHATASGDGAGGGGAGGTILLEAGTVIINGALAVNGGAGGTNAGGSGTGASGLLSRVAATAGTSAGASGGNGGAGNIMIGSPGAAGSTAGGGGGGGVGRIRVNTKPGAPTLGPSAVLSPGPQDPGTTYSVGPVKVE